MQYLLKLRFTGWKKKGLWVSWMLLIHGKYRNQERRNDGNEYYSKWYNFSTT